MPQDPNDEPSVLLERIRAQRTPGPEPARGRRRKSAVRIELELPVR
jgi:hypothetical protein